jgi:hypothetical protein
MNKIGTGRETHVRGCRSNSDLRNLQTPDVWNLQTPDLRNLQTPDIRNLQKQPIIRHPNRYLPPTAKAVRR